MEYLLIQLSYGIMINKYGGLIMTREEAKELLPIIQAWVKGKEIQFKACSGKWIDVEENEGLSFICPPSDYRIKPEPKYRPFKNQEECWQEMHNHPNFGWLKRNSTGRYVHISVVSSDNLMFFCLTHIYKFRMMMLINIGLRKRYMLNNTI